MGRKAVSGYQGRSGKVFYDGVEICVTEWNLDYSAEEEETTNSCSGGFYESEFGIRKAEGSFTADWDVDLSPFAGSPAPAIDLGEIVVLKLYVHAANSSDEPFWSFNARVRSVSMSVPSKGKVSYTCSFVSVGAINTPQSDASG